MNTETPTPNPEDLREALRQVIDPEIGMNIVDLGLIYDIDVGADEVKVSMTMTSPACPMADMIIGDIDAVLDVVLPEHYRVTVQLVWDPPWTPERMQPGAKKHFGW